jgi:UDP-2,3-diacylglucosamine pyrophosphatase LpxH
VIKNYPWRAVKLIFKYVPLAWRVAKKNYLREALKLVFKAFQYLVIPIVFFFLVVLPIIMPAFKTFIQAIPWVGKYLADIKIGTLISILSALNPFILALFKRKRDLVTAAMQKIIQDNPGINIQYVILGHLHLGDRRRYRNCTYYNCGSWTPKIVLEEKLRSSINFTFIRIDKKQNGGFYEPLIQEWNDCAGRFDEVKLYETAESKRQKKIQKRYDSI